MPQEMSDEIWALAMRVYHNDLGHGQFTRELEAIISRHIDGEWIAVVLAWQRNEMGDHEALAKLLAMIPSAPPRKVGEK